MIFSRSPLLEFCLIFLLLLAVVFFGAVYEWMEMGIYALIFLFLFFHPDPEFFFRLKKSERVLLCLLFVWIAVQALGLSQSPYDSGLEWIRFLGSLGLFFLVFQLEETSARRRLLWGIALIGAGEALYEIFQKTSGDHSVLWKTKIAYQGFATGTYINRNHFAGFLEMALGVQLGLLCDAFSKKKFFSAAVIGGIFLLCLDTLFRTGSRLGILSFILAAGAGLGWMAIKQKRAWLPVVPFILLAGLFFKNSGNLSRFWDSGAGSWSLLGRLGIWRDTLRMIQDYPWQGVGLGAFSWAILRYQGRNLLEGWNHAHQDYLELAATGGLVFFILLVILFLRPGFSAVKKIFQSKNTNVFFCLGLLISLAAMLIHGMGDFNFAIPANRILFMALAALLFKSANDSGVQRKPAAGYPGKLAVRVLAGVLFLLCSWKAWAGLAVYRGSEALEKRDYTAAVSILEKGDLGNPKNLILLGKSLQRDSVRSRNPELLTRSEAVFEKLTQKVPAYGRGWIYRAKARIKKADLSQSEAAEIRSWVQKALSLEPNGAWMNYQAAVIQLSLKGLTSQEKDQALGWLRKSVEIHYPSQPPAYLKPAFKFLWEKFQDVSLLTEITPEKELTYRMFIEFLEANAIWREMENGEKRYRSIRDREYEEFFAQGMDLMKRDKKVEALSFFQKAYWIDQQNPKAKTCLLGLEYELEAQRAGSLAELKKVLEEADEPSEVCLPEIKAFVDSIDDAYLHGLYAYQIRDQEAGRLFFQSLGEQLSERGKRFLAEDPAWGEVYEIPATQWWRKGHEGSQTLGERARIGVPLPLRPGRVELKIKLRSRPSQTGYRGYLRFRLWDGDVERMLDSIYISQSGWQEYSLSFRTQGGNRWLEAELYNGSADRKKFQGPSVDFGGVRISYHA